MSIHGFGCGCECGSQWLQCSQWLHWSCPPNLCKSYQGLEPFSSDLYLGFKLNIFFCLRQKYNCLPLVLGFFFCSNYGRMFSSFHQSCSLCICKRLLFPFFKFHKFAPCPDFLALAVCQLPKIVAGSCWWLNTGTGRLGAEEAVLDARALHRHQRTSQSGPLVLQQYYIIIMFILYRISEA